MSIHCKRTKAVTLQMVRQCVENGKCQIAQGSSTLDTTWEEKAGRSSCHLENGSVCAAENWVHLRKISTRGEERSKM